MPAEKVSISFDPKVLAAARSAAGGNLSAFVNEAVEERLELRRKSRNLQRLMQQWIEEWGPPTPEEEAWAKRLRDKYWPE